MKNVIKILYNIIEELYNRLKKNKPISTLAASDKQSKKSQPDGTGDSKVSYHTTLPGSGSCPA